MTLLTLRSLKELKVDTVGHRLIAGVVRMQMVPAVVRLQKLAGVFRIASGTVEIDHAIEIFCAAYPCIYGLALRFARFTCIGCLRKRRQGSPDNLEPARMRTFS